MSFFTKTKMPRKNMQALRITYVQSAISNMYVLYIGPFDSGLDGMVENKAVFDMIQDYHDRMDSERVDLVLCQGSLFPAPLNVRMSRVTRRLT